MIPNLLWHGPQREVDALHAEATRLAVQSDALLLEAARNFRPSTEHLKELVKYDRKLPKGALP